MNDGKPIDGFTLEGTTNITIDRRIYCGYCKKEITEILYTGFCGGTFHNRCWGYVEDILTRKLSVAST